MRFMKRLVQVMLFLVASHAVAQADFANGYVITVSGYLAPDSDPNEANCGSGYNLNVVYEDNGQQTIVPHVGIAGLGRSNFSGRIEFLSTRKVSGIFIYAKNQHKPLFGGCRGPEGQTILPISLLTDYPCGERTIPVYIATYRGEVTFKIQPLSKGTTKLNVSAQLVNDSNENVDVPLNPDDFCSSISPLYTTDYKTNYNYSLSTSFSDHTSAVMLSGSTPYFSGGSAISNQTSILTSSGKYPLSFTLSTSGGVSKYYVDSGGEGGGGSVQCGPEVQVTTFNTFTITNPGLEEDTTFNFKLYSAAGTSNITVKIDNYGFPIKCNSGILPSDTSSRVMLVGPSPNVPSFYHWVYSTDGVHWTDLPSKFQGKNRIRVSGYDLLGDGFIDYHNHSIFFKIVIDCNGGESETLTLSGRLSAPNIVSILPMPDRCYAVERDGAFKITFSRALHVPATGNKEQLIVTARDLSNANPPDQILDVTLDENNSFTWPRRLQSDKEYEISLLGKFQDAATYTDNPVKHYGTVKLIRPTPVSSDINAQAVHCYGGGDGKISIVVRGGAGNYSFESVKTGSGDTIRISLGTDTTYIHNFLYSGTYRIDLRDGNNCSDRAGIKSILVSQPDDSLHVAYSHPVDPLAYGYTDGYIETILTGGTPNPDKSYTVQWYDPSNILPDALYNNSPLSEGYQANIDSLGDGYYILKAYDSQYALAHPDHRKGCWVESDTFHLIQPPPLVITLRENHFINCHGFDNGEIAAHAEGGIRLPNGLPYIYEWLIENEGVTQPVQQSDSIAIGLRTGTYRLRITDKNNIHKLSAPFLLVEPDVLESQVTTTPVSCSAGADGTANALVKGGTLPYHYEWSTGDNTSSTVTRLIEGTYFVFVTDIRGCTTTASGKVATPYPLQVDSVLTPPQCFGYHDGAINITVQDGTPPYAFEWSNGELTEDIAGLSEGSYRVVIIDKNNCRSYREYTLEDPEQVIINLGPDRYLCNDQQYTADASIKDGDAQYTWQGPHGFTASTPKVVIDQEGTYTVNATDSHGCNAKDDLSITRIGIDINSEFIVSTQVFAEQEVTLLNISSPAPDSVQWLLDGQPGIRFDEKQSNKAVVVFEADGTYTLYLKTFRQGCEEVSSKTITVVGKSIQEQTTQKEPFIERFTVAPNPSAGVFTVSVDLLEVSSIRLRLIPLTSNVAVSDRAEQGSDQYELPYTLDLAAGTYILLLETPKGNSLLKIVIYE